MLLEENKKWRANRQIGAAIIMQTIRLGRENERYIAEAIFA
jgi:hypothetical protein